MKWKMKQKIIYYIVGYECDYNEIDLDELNALDELEPKIYWWKERKPTAKELSEILKKAQNGILISGYHDECEILKKKGIK